MYRIKFKLFYAFNMITNIIECIVICSVWMGEGFPDPSNIHATYLTCGILVFVLFVVHGGVYLILEKETELVQGENKSLRKEMKKNLEMKVEIKVKQAKLENLHEEKRKKEEELKLKRENLGLQCEIRKLENELKQEFQVCERCGTKSSLKACYCPECGEALKKEVMVFK